ncbi:MAG: phosphatidylglycerol lysyltransferase domain-containing protein, partial [Aeromonadaceae bacterium]
SLFYRRGSLVNAPFSVGWSVAFFSVLLGGGWLLLFSYRQVDYSHQLWLDFSPDGDASRALRALGSVIGVAAAAGVAYLLNSSRQRPSLPDEEQLNRAEAIIAQAADSHGHLALLGDKFLLFHDSGEAFIMYAIAGRSWVVMGDPIGEPSRFDELLWQFRELCDLYDGWPVFYQVKPEFLPTYIELGLSPYRLGEEAVVALGDFTLVGSKLRGLRQSHAKAVRDGLSFSVVPAEQVAEILPELKEISDRWLEEKQGREKGFSVGYFHEPYLCRTPVALVHSQGRLAGFANLWCSESRQELSVDLMRYHPELTNGAVMDFLFTELMLWGQAQGYARFNLGMAPMAGFASHPLAPFWNKMASRLYASGGRFYNFQGLHRYKDKYHPDWQPRYLLSPGGMSLPLILTNLVTLISRGALGVVHK